MKKLAVLIMISLIALAGCQSAETSTQPAQDTEPLFRNTGQDSVNLMTEVSSMVSGNTYEFEWEVLGGNSIRNTRVQASTSPDFSSIIAESSPNNNGPGIYNGNLVVEESGNVYVRAIAIIDGEEAVSQALEVSVESRNQETEEQETEQQESMEDPEIQEVKVEAYQFGFSPDPITVRKDVPVRLFVTSTDVDHGISIPQFGVSTAAPAGETVIIEFTPDKTGEFSYFCNVYCGQGHSSMEGTLIVEE